MVVNFIYKYYCEKCKKQFETRKKEQRFCSRSCANSINTSKRKIEDESIFLSGLNDISAYVLGIIMSDGCLSFDNHSKRFRITISMNEYEFIEKLRKMYTPTKKLYSYKARNALKTTYTFISSNKSDIEFLKSLGIYTRKSKILRFPKIEEKYERIVIKGIFDGDGSVYINKTVSNGKIYKYINTSITTGSENFAEDILDILTKNGINAHKVKDSRKKDCWYIKIYSKDAVKKFYEYLYEDSKLHLKRKYDLFKKMI